MNPVFKELTKYHKITFKKMLKDLKHRSLSPKPYLNLIFSFPTDVALSMFLYIFDSKKYKEFLVDYEAYQKDHQHYYLFIDQYKNCCLITPNKQMHYGRISLADSEYPNYLSFQEQYVDINDSVKENLDIVWKIKEAIKTPKTATEILYDLRKVKTYFCEEIINEVKEDKKIESYKKEKEEMEKLLNQEVSGTVKKRKI